MATSSIKEVARRAGVSIATVSNVLNRPELVADVTRQRVLDAIRDLGYVRNDSARQLRAGHSRMIAVMVLDVANPFFTDVVRGVEQVVDDTGAMVIVCNSGDDPTRESRQLDHLLEQRVRGLLITPVRDETIARLGEFTDRGIPVVLVDRGAGTRNRCSVAVDDVLGGRLAADHLIAAGHSRIAFVGGPSGIRQVSDRYAGATAAAAEAGLEITFLEMPALTTAYGRSAGQRLADGLEAERPTAVFCANDLLALGVLQEMMRRGIKVPEDIAIVGYDDIEYAAAAPVPLTSVAQPRDHLGRTAAELLLDEITDGDRHRHRQVLFEPELVVRESSAP